MHVKGKTARHLQAPGTLFFHSGKRKCYHCDKFGGSESVSSRRRTFTLWRRKPKDTHYKRRRLEQWCVTTLGRSYKRSGSIVVPQTVGYSPTCGTTEVTLPESFLKPGTTGFWRPRTVRLVRTGGEELFTRF